MGDLLKEAGPWGQIVVGMVVICFLAGSGFIALAVRWKKIKSFISDSGSSGMPLRRESDLINRLIIQNAEMMGTMVQVVRDNTAALQKVSVAVEAIERGFSTIHRRLDEALAERHHG